MKRIYLALLTFGLASVSPSQVLANASPTFKQRDPNQTYWTTRTGWHCFYRTLDVAWDDDEFICYDPQWPTKESSKAYEIYWMRDPRPIFQFSGNCDGWYEFNSDAIPARFKVEERHREIMQEHGKARRAMYTPLRCGRTLTR